ncbi:GntR family transcriptional regulator [Kribbella sp. NPDC051952]|uniref:GntR family transcriptional regulator n=1 Tax=Kribbella sp. NPDC051952 TaxID=3154851 RepID=UPI003449F247
MTTLDVPNLGGGLNLRQRIRDVLRASIISGAMHPGPVYSAPTLSQQFGVSSTPVREALLDLVAEGLVEAVRNKGFRVTQPSDKQLDDITAVRRMLEVPGMAQLAGSLTDAQREKVQSLYPAAHDLVELAARRELVDWVQADRRFHLELLGLVGNAVLLELVANLRARSRLTGLDSLGIDALVASSEEHVTILDLLLAGDEAGLIDVMGRHIDHIRGAWAGRPEEQETT